MKNFSLGYMGHNHNNLNHSITMRLMITMVLNFIIMVTEIIGGLISGSLSLVSDALHNFSDGISIIISFIALKLKQRDHSFRHTFGLKRAEILAAIINSVVLVIISIYLFYESFNRLMKPEDVQGGIMIIIALIGLTANTVGTLLLKADSEHSMNIKSSYLHLLSDAISSVAVVAGGILIYFWKIYWVDPLLTIAIGIYILKESYSILSQAIHILMEGAPRDISIEGIRNSVEKVDNVRNIHHLHIWMVGDNDIHLEAHINIKDMMISQCDGLRKKVENILSEEFHVNHITLQFECNQCPNEGLIKNGTH
jgi:cobalt-zinc-cadmium efflux system protein